MLLTKFDGGLSIRLDPSLIQPNEGVVYTNIDTDKGVLTNCLNYTEMDQEVRGFFYNFKNKWVSSYLERSYAEFNNKLYFSEALTYPQKFDGERYTRLGIQGPVEKLNASEAAATAIKVSDFNISAEGLACRSLYITEDGYTLFTLDETNNEVDQWKLGTAWDITTAVYEASISIAAKETNATGITFKPNGTRFYIVGNNRTIYEYYMSVAWDITTAVFSTSLSAVGTQTTPQSITFNDTGSMLFILDSTDGKITQYNVSTAYTLSSITLGVELDISARDSALTGIFFKPDGKRLYAVGYTNDKVYEYSLETAWDLETAVYYGVLADISTDTTTSTDIFFSPDMRHMYISSEPSASIIAQYDVQRISSNDATVQYVYTYYNSIDDVESVPSPESVEFNVKAIRSVTVEPFIPSLDPQVDKIRLYRIGDNTTSFTLVAELDSTVISYTDSIPTTELTDILASSDYYPAKDGLKYLTEAYGKLFGAVDNKLYFSITNKPDAWPEAYYILFKKNITGILPTSDGILVFMANDTDILHGTDVDNFARRNLSHEQGCTSHYTAKYVQNMPIWQSEEGFCAYSSGNIKVVSKDKLGTTNFNIVNAAVWDETYFACLADGTVLAVSTKFDQLRFKNFSFTLPLENIYAADGDLYGSINTDRLAKLFTGDSVPFTYRSPIFVDDSHSNVKTYNSIYVRASGTLNINIYIDEVLVNSYTITGNKTHELNVPQEDQKGYNLQFEITGIGTVYEIEYKVMERQNGK